MFKYLIWASFFIPTNVPGVPKQILLILPALTAFLWLISRCTLTKNSVYLATLLLCVSLLGSISGLFTVGDISLYLYQDIYWVMSSVGILAVASFARPRVAKTQDFYDVYSTKVLRFIVFAFLLGLMLCWAWPAFNEAQANLYSEDTQIYSPGYNLYRYFGTIGQPGRAGMVYFLILCLTCMIGSSRKKGLWDIKIALLFLVAATQSRLAFGFSILMIFGSLAIVEINLQRAKRLLMISGVVVVTIIVFSGNKFSYYGSTSFAERLLDGNTTTASHRMDTKALALETISKNSVSLYFGVGANKEYLTSIRQNISAELSMWTPDSSQTVFLIRNGLLGSIAIYAIVALGHLRVRRLVTISETRRIADLFFVLLMVYSFFDPIFHSFKASPLLALISIYLIYGSFIHLARQPNELPSVPPRFYRREIEQ